MLGDAQHVEEVEKIDLDFVDVKALNDLKVLPVGGSPPPRATKLPTRAAGPSLASSYWPCIYWPHQLSHAHIRANLF
ncbi:hypothetical protein ACOSP7_010313 [Xanthoceras sorbifolium]